MSDSPDIRAWLEQSQTGPLRRLQAGSRVPSEGIRAVLHEGLDMVTDALWELEQVHAAAGLAVSREALLDGVRAQLAARLADPSRPSAAGEAGVAREDVGSTAQECGTRAAQYRESIAATEAARMELQEWHGEAIRTQPDAQARAAREKALYGALDLAKAVETDKGRAFLWAWGKATGVAL